GESLPRWTIELVGRADAVPLWPSADAAPTAPRDAGVAERLARALAARLGVEGGVLLPAFEDPWRLVQDEAALPADVDPLATDLRDPEARRRLARLLACDPREPAGFVLPLRRDESRWRTERWSFRRERLYLLPGDSPLGLRLPLSSLVGDAEPPTPHEAPASPPDPRRSEAETEAARAAAQRTKAVRTALCVELREGQLHVFLPPVERAEDFLELVAAVDAVRREVGADVQLEGYPPPPSPLLRRLSVTPDPGVLEVNIPPSPTARAHVSTLEAVHDAALHAGLHSERYLLDGRLSGSGGGHHVTAGGPTPLESPLVRRPDLLASLITFLQHHPSLSFLFTGLFVGPTSQAPRVDEARHDSLYELEIALAEAYRAEAPPPWLGDLLFRHLLVDVTGNTHRAEISIDKLFDWRTPHGRQGVVELRAFEMPPHPRLAAAQAILVRALLASFARAPYRGALVRWGAALHDRFLLPTWLWQDFEDVLEHLRERGIPLPPEPFRAYVDLRCPVAGRVDAGGVSVEVRNALEPWHVLGEEPGASGGTSRYVDSSVERIEVRAEGIVRERHQLLVNGFVLPMRPTGTAGEQVGGVRFRAWAPPHALHAHLGIHHPVRIEVLDRWGHRSMAACAYHVWHPEGRGYDTPPLTRFEAAARRARRFTVEGPSPWPVTPVAAEPHPDMPWTLDLRRFPGDRPMPKPDPEDA
ncbi:MAG TPA: transglutaminase family protein, partial [Anaeromyxobacter sp.]